MRHDRTPEHSDGISLLVYRFHEIDRVRLERARIQDPLFFAVKHAVVRHQTARGRVERALAYGPRAAFNDLPRPGREPTITAEAKAWLADLVCRRAKEFG
jgi:hypothetical protein